MSTPKRNFVHQIENPLSVCLSFVKLLANPRQTSSATSLTFYGKNWLPGHNFLIGLPNWQPAIFYTFLLCISFGLDLRQLAFK